MNHELADPFETIVNTHYEPLYRFAMSLTRAESDARDLTQQTFYIWAKKGHQLRDISKVKTWLYTTLHRAFLVRRRRQSRFPHDNLEEVEAQLPALTPAPADHMDASQVLTALAEVDEVFQPAVALFYLEDRSYKDIAAILEVPIGTVKSRIARGLDQLRSHFENGRARRSARADGDSPAEDGHSQLEQRRARSDAPHHGGAGASCGEIPSSSDHASESEYVEWDLSSTFLPELLGVV